MFLVTQILIDQGQRILERCNELIQYCGQEHWRRNQATIENKIRILKQEIDQYEAQIDLFKPIVKTFGLQIYEDIKRASEIIRHGNNAIIGGGISAAGCALVLEASFSTGGLLGTQRCASCW